MYLHIVRDTREMIKCKQAMAFINNVENHFEQPNYK